MTQFKQKLMQISDTTVDTVSGIAVGSAGCSILTFPWDKVLSGGAAIVAIVTGVYAALYHRERKAYVREKREYLARHDVLPPGESLDENDA